VPIYFLSFNIGFSFGIAAALTYWANSAQANYARLTEYVTPFNEAMHAPFLPPGWDVTDPETAATLASEITRQAGMIAYNNTFVVAAIAALCIIPLVYMLTDPGWRRAG
jgi:DHA2 family multidrug resistance protein